LNDSAVDSARKRPPRLIDDVTTPHKSFDVQTLNNTSGSDQDSSAAPTVASATPAVARAPVAVPRARSAAVEIPQRAPVMKTKSHTAPKVTVPLANLPILPDRPVSCMTVIPTQHPPKSSMASDDSLPPPLLPRTAGTTLRQAPGRPVPTGLQQSPLVHQGDFNSTPPLPPREINSLNRSSKKSGVATRDAPTAPHAASRLASATR